MKVMLVGANGQLGRELMSTQAEWAELLSFGSDTLDIGDKEQLRTAISELRPDVLINAAAYTAVDKAEAEREKAYKVNVSGAKNLAELCKEFNIRLIHISTDFVFDGTASRPYQEDAASNPINYYGKTKLLAEQAIAEILPKKHLIIRTAWLYSSYGNNFVKTMLRLMNEKDELKIVADQVGTPTYAKKLASLIWQCCQRSELTGIYHWSDAGVASWYDFAMAVQEEALERKLLNKNIPIQAVSTREFPTSAKRPSYSVLDKGKMVNALAIKPVHWRVALRQMLDDLKVKHNE